MAHREGLSVKVLFFTGNNDVPKTVVELEVFRAERAATGKSRDGVECVCVSKSRCADSGAPICIALLIWNA